MAYLAGDSLQDVVRVGANSFAQLRGADVTLCVLASSADLFSFEALRRL